MISRPKLTIVFAIYFAFCMFFVFYERIVLTEGMKQIREFDRAFYYACDNAAETLKNHVYEENVYGMVKDAFSYSFSLAMNMTDLYDIGSVKMGLEEISFSVNGNIVEPVQLDSIKDSDTLELYVSYEDVCINAYGRRKYISRHFAKSVR